MKLIDTLRDYENIWPEYHVPAAEHRPSCKCAVCIMFHALCGLEQLEHPSPEWQALREEDCPMEVNEHLGRPMGIPSREQVARVHALAMRLL